MKFKNFKFSIKQSIPSLGICPRDEEAKPHGNLYSNVHNSLERKQTNVRQLANE